MIIQRSNLFSIKKYEKQFRDAGLAQGYESIRKISQLYLLRHSALNEIGTKLENLDDEYSANFDHNPIHHMEERMKEPGSLLGKISRKQIPVDTNDLFGNIYDIAGIRVITNYLDDIIKVRDALVKQSDVTVIKEKDYINHPKPNGYRSYHLIVSVPVFQDEGVQEAPVEIQIRTVGMDTWASLEHDLRYKSFADQEKADQYAAELAQYANALFGIEENMQRIFTGLQSENDEHQS
ncbi:GTP pyrophosphokinase family protein [Lentilactobacillus sp. SPB1-3]|uniref:GTP pyrophosphokinase family protein n=1 Tax=Lentilactobacillus terminaliae TaxID=3003483 RepID=A0ACD5DE73_9LACO|nr:GTP pyrophosphokinase family protein [Lentilactobacillus sp. SPB1-3]MCZ0977467.1 GTP pyrophosphokinase family protein [Lentilactobacillus sp. SPB1-3]